MTTSGAGAPASLDGQRLPGLEEGEEPRYWAFISYSHSDESWARWLHTGLETYGIPRKLWGRPSSRGPVPRRMFPCFRDRDELAGAAELGAKLRTALRLSRTLVVICSPRSARSKWVNEEVREFKTLGRSDRVLCLIVEGEPNVSGMAGREAEECFPPAIRFQVAADGALTDEPAEPVAADARPGKDGRSLALLKVISGLLDVGFDELRQRDLQRQRMRRLVMTGLAALALVMTSALYVGLADAGLPLPASTAIRRGLDRRGLSVLRPVRPLDQIRRAGVELRTQLLRSVMERGVRKDGWINCTLRKGAAPCREVWAHAQALYGVLSAPEAPPGGRVALLGMLDRPFGTGEIIEARGRRYGWISHEGDVDILAEPALWLMAALASGRHAAAQPAAADAAAADPAIRQQLDAHLADVQSILAAGHLGTGPAAGWNMFVDQIERNRHNCYTSSLALLALLELRRTGLPFGGSSARRDELILGAARWLSEQFQADAVVPGWGIFGKKDTNTTLDVFDGLTLQIYGLLLQAEEEAGFVLPAEIVAAIGPHLERTVTRELSFPTGSGEFFVRYQGVDRMVPGKEQIGFLWYPWAVRAASWWLRRSARVGALPEERVAVQRALGHLVLDIGPAAVTKAGKDPTFIPAETLIGLAAIAEAR
jgi:hypothetical protein